MNKLFAKWYLCPYKIRQNYIYFVFSKYQFNYLNDLHQFKFIQLIFLYFYYSEKVRDILIIQPWMD